MQLVEQNWDTYVRQMRDLVLSGQALRDGKLNNAAYISWRYINFAAVRESVHFVFDLIQATYVFPGISPSDKPSASLKTNGTPNGDVKSERSSPIS
jgi:hypothetical protein